MRRVKKNYCFPWSGLARVCRGSGFIAAVFSRTLFLIVSLTTFMGFAATEPILSLEAERYVDHLAPLPHQIVIASRWTGSPKEVAVLTAGDADTGTLNAAAEVRGRIESLTGAAPSGDAFKIVIGVLDSDGMMGRYPVKRASQLRTVPNADQAYVVEPVGDAVLLVCGLTGKGAYYGAVTINQLLGVKSSRQSLTVPLAEILDWPDMAERGLWNSGVATPGFIPWMAGLKLNFEHFSHNIDMNPRAERCPPLPIDRIEQAKEYAFNLIPHCPHYDFWIINNQRYYPSELIGQGDAARNPLSVKVPGYCPGARAPCSSSPLLHKYLTEWMVSAAKQGAREMSLWLTEYQPSYCSCGQCLPDGRPRQLLWDTAATVRAIADARKVYPDIVVRIFFPLSATWHLPVDYCDKKVGSSV